MALHPLGSVDPFSLVDARLQLHHAAQFVAAFGQSLLEARSDDSHRTMHWDASSERFLSEPTEDELQIFVTPDPFSIGLMREATDISSLRLMGATMRTARVWAERAIRDATDRADFELEWPEYEMPDHFVIEGRPFQAKSASMKELSRWFSGASVKLNRLTLAEADAEPVRTWPHHFDIATLIVVERDGDGNPTQTVGVGMSPGDEGTSEPYWYVNAWGYSDAAAFPELHAPGHTHREGWSGFVMTATELIEAGREGRADPSGEGKRQADALESFLDRAVSSAKALFAV